MGGGRQKRKKTPDEVPLARNFSDVTLRPRVMEGTALIMTIQSVNMKLPSCGNMFFSQVVKSEHSLSGEGGTPLRGKVLQFACRKSLLDHYYGRISGRSCCAESSSTSEHGEHLNKSPAFSPVSSTIHYHLSFLTTTPW